jgi:hypothetical protein
MVSSVIISTFYFNKFLCDDEVEYQSDVFIEGLNVSLPAFLFMWIVCFTYNKILILDLSNKQEF